MKIDLKSIARKLARGGFVAGSLIGGFKAGLGTQWEGGESNRLRRRPGRALESQDRGVNYGVREDLLSEARSQAQTFPLARSINRKYANHCVGSLRIKWNTGDDSVDRIYHDAWQMWMKISDLGGRHHFRKQTKMAVESVLRDGAIFSQLDRRAGILQIAPIESDRVSSAGIYNADVPGLIGGITLDGNGRAVSARVWERTIYGYFQNPVEIPRAEYVHMFDSDRFDAVTGVTHYHTILNALRDLKETGEAERLSAKRNSKLALLIKTIMGGASAPAIQLFGNQDDTQGAAGKVNVEEVGDVAQAYMFPNEDIKAHTSDRPSMGWQWLMEWLVREIALGLDLPFGVVWNMAGLGGPAVRFEMAQAHRVFMAFLEDILEPMWTRPIVGAWLTLEISQGRLPFNPNWYKFKTPRPVAITIDVGRDSKAGIAENTAGLDTATHWYAEDDRSFEDETDRLAYEAAYRRRAILPYEKDGVVLEDIRVLGTANTKITEGNPDDPNAEPVPAGPAKSK